MSQHHTSPAQADLSGRLELLIVRPELLPPPIHAGVTNAMQRGLAGVIVTPVWTARIATMLRGSGTAVGTVVSFPHGTSKSTVKAIEATSCIKDGADAIYITPHLPNLIRQDLDAMKHELLEIVRAARATRRDVQLHVIVETSVLRQLASDQFEPALAVACRAVRESACDGIVTGSGLIPGGGADAKEIALLRKHVEGLQITAAGQVDDIEMAQALLTAGADRIASERAAEMVV